MLESKIGCEGACTDCQEYLAELISLFPVVVVETARLIVLDNFTVHAYGIHDFQDDKWTIPGDFWVFS